MAEECDGGQQVPGADIGANLAGGRSGIEQVAKDGPKPLPEVAGKGVERRVAECGAVANPRLVATNSVYRCSHCVSAVVGSWPALRAGPAAAQASISRSSTATTRSERRGKCR